MTFACSRTLCRWNYIMYWASLIWKLRMFQNPKLWVSGSCQMYSESFTCQSTLHFIFLVWAWSAGRICKCSKNPCRLPKSYNTSLPKHFRYGIVSLHIVTCLGLMFTFMCYVYWWLSPFHCLVVLCSCPEVCIFFFFPLRDAMTKGTCAFIYRCNHWFQYNWIIKGMFNIIAKKPLE